jgi:catechol 2,3-dioxygenase-like lactoylglutathione lyase family enzyme
VSAIGHVALRVRDIAAAVTSATEVIGLQVTEEREGVVYLSDGSPHHSLTYIAADVDAVDHVGLLARDDAALDDIRRRVDDMGLAIVSETPLGAATARGFAFEAPGGFVFEIYRDMAQVPCNYSTPGIRPLRFGHVTLNPRDPLAMRRLLEDVLDFRVSEIAGPGTFLRCNADHHGIGVFPGDGVLHHHAWEVPSIVELGQLADRIDARGGSVLWGPGRHSLGNNIAVYFEDTCGVVVEYYAEMVRIYDEQGFVPKTWDPGEGHKVWSLWDPHMPAGFAERGLAPAIR